jgi:enolase
MSGRRSVQVALRGVLTSMGAPTVEAEVRFSDGTRGTGSCPVAIAAGRLERRRGHRPGLGPLDGPFAVLAEHLTGVSADGQADWDALLVRHAEKTGLGTDTTLPLSLAYCRAEAEARGTELYARFADLAGTRPAMPSLLVNVFSGGIHRAGPPDSFQQIMMVVDGTDTAGAVGTALTAYARLERRYRDAPGAGGLSASSGLLLDGVSTEELLGVLRSELDALGAGFALGFDAAAEHLATGDGDYRFEGRTLSGARFGRLVEDLAVRYGVGYVEDPYDPADEELWRATTARLTGRSEVIGDDLFATDPDRLRSGPAHGLVVKMNQIGTVSGTVAAVRRAQELGLSCCVSHRSGETEDTAMCDLAVGIGARHIKVGGPRRGDRTAKYNQLLRLAELVAPRSAASAAEPSLP